MPLMKVRKEDDTGWYTVDHLNFNYIGLGINEPITLVQAKTKENYNNLNKIYVYNGKDDYPYDGTAKEELLYKSTMLNELQNNWMPKLLEYTSKTPILENEQKNINITDPSVYPGEPGTLLLEHRQVKKIKQQFSNNTKSSIPKSNITPPKITKGYRINTETGESKHAIPQGIVPSYYAITDFFDPSTVLNITPEDDVEYYVHVYDKDETYKGQLKPITNEIIDGGDTFNTDLTYDEKISTSSWNKKYIYRLCGYTRNSNLNTYWTFELASASEEDEPENNGSSTEETIVETFHILNYWDANNKKWVPLNNIWG